MLTLVSENRSTPAAPVAGWSFIDLHGLSTQDFVPALEGFLGSGAGLSERTITRLTTQRQDDARAFDKRDLSSVDCPYVWADGVHLNIRLDEEKLCLLVLVGVRVDGRKELITLAQGYRESIGSRADLLRDAKRRGMRAPVLAAQARWRAVNAPHLVALVRAGARFEHDHLGERYHGAAA